ncbi:IS1634 family transposase [Roseburia sp. AM59-24XD]|uniref:IS1634 family transposase n=1 Tax=Roseburia sp. AM59-24XD TaxID=2293138 RepID=UPI000E4EA1AC|nr:IS1634 family transposase [Roseburia sp. AM59-24XD]RHP79917.1 IS1634 family transposase [Roseburia sp. AM59-24XD]
MKVSISKSKNTTIYYLSRSVRVGNKTTTKTVEKIGTYDEIKKICGDMDPLDWAKEYAAKRTAEEKAHKQDIIMRYSSSALIDKNVRRSCNAGYLFLQDIHYSLGLDKICNSISEKYKFDYDLNDILSMLVYSRIIAPGSKLSSLENAQKFLEQPKCELHQVYRALEVIAKENDFFQAELYKNSQKVVNRKKEVLYYDCTNYYFEIENEDVFRKYSVSKEHRPNPIVQMGMFMDADGIPLAFSVFDGNQNEQPSMSPLEQKIIKDFEASDFIVCTDAGLSSTANRKFNSIQGRGFVTTQSIKKLKGFLQDFCLEDDGWYLPGSNKKYKLSELDEETDYEKVFYKDRWINENNLEQHLIVTYSIKYRNYQRTIRERQIERAKKFVESPSKLTKNRANDPKRFIEQGHCTPDGEIASKTITSLNQNQIDNEAKYDGLYAVCTNLEYDVSSIIKINQKRWEIEECFRIMKTEFKARPVYLSRKDRITAHFTTCFTALVIYRILEQKLNEKYTCEELIDTIRSMDMLIAPGEGYIPTYTRTDITDALHDAFGFRTDYQITSQKNMRKILNQTKKK